MKKYARHAPDYAIGENEKLYSDMAAKGWLLEKRGAYLSRFGRGKPEKRIYRVEIASPAPLDDDSALPEEQIALYEDCGWNFVTRRGLVNVFCAPQGSCAPEIHSDPTQQAATLRALRRNYTLGWIPAVILFAVNFLLAASVTGGADAAWRGFVADMQVNWVRRTALFLLLYTALGAGAYFLFYGALRTRALYRRLKRGKPLDHAPIKRRLAHKTFSCLLILCCLASAAFAIVQWAQNEKYDMPAVSDGPYLLLADLGWEGGRAMAYGTDKTSSVETARSLLAVQWYTYECVRTAQGSQCSLYQDLYQVAGTKQAKALARILTHSGLFARDAADFAQVEAVGLDLAYQADFEYIAVKGEYVYYIILLEPGDGTRTDVLAALGEMTKEGL